LPDPAPAGWRHWRHNHFIRRQIDICADVPQLSHRARSSCLCSYNDDVPLETRIKNGHFPLGSRPVPYRPKPTAPSFSILNPKLQDLFIQCFERGHEDPRKRPDSRSWQNTLDEAENLLETCSVNRQHVYSNHLKACPWCERTKLLNGRSGKSRQGLSASPSVSPEFGQTFTQRSGLTHRRGVRYLRPRVFRCFRSGFVGAARSR
jgi:hypothetical protein